MTNYGWVAPHAVTSTGEPAADRDDYLERLALLVARRADMELITIVDTLRGFVLEANDRADPPPPIDTELVVGGHANPMGEWLIRTFPGGGPVDFEALRHALEHPDDSVAIPDALIGVTQSDPQPTARNFHVKGCSIGRVHAWLLKLREALGGHVRVTAPKHFHGVSTNGTPGVTSVDVIEWMAYEFVVHQRDALSGLGALAEAFHAKGYTAPDGMPIPLASFRAWLKALRVRRYDQAATVVRSRVRLPLGRRIMGLATTEGEMGFYIQTSKLSVVSETFTFDSAQDVPATDAACQALLPAWLRQDAIYRDDHQFPRFVRLGYATLEEMIAGLKWHYSRNPDSDPPSVDCLGGRFEYVLMIPIATAGPGGSVAATKAPLIYNHIPEAGLPAKPPAFDETSPFFYATVP